MLYFKVTFSLHPAKESGKDFTNMGKIIAIYDMANKGFYQMSWHYIGKRPED